MAWFEQIFRRAQRTWFDAMPKSLRANAASLARELEVDNKARRAGEQNLPGGDDVDMDAAQRLIVARTEAGAHQVKQHFARQTQAANERIAAQSPRPLNADLALASADLKVAGVKLDYHDELRAKRLAERQGLRRLRKFQREHGGVTRPARYEDEPWLPGAVMAGLVVIEALANAALFMQAVDGGFLQALVLAVIFGAVNVALGFVGGIIGLRLITAPSLSGKAVGVVSSAAAWSAGLYWNLRISGFRDALEAGVHIDPFAQAQSLSVILQGLGSASPEAMALLIVGVLVFLVAAMKGRGGAWSFVDPIWGYKAADLDYREVETAYQIAKDRYRRGIDEIYENAHVLMRRQHDSDGAVVAEFRLALDESAIAAREARDAVDGWTNAANALLRRYREENIAVRTDEPPAYYATFVADVGGRWGFEDLRAMGEAERAIEIHESNDEELIRLERLLTQRRREAAQAFLEEIERLENREEEAIEAAFASDDEPLRHAPEHEALH